MISLSPPACDLSNGEPPTGVFKYEMDLKCTAFLALTPGTVLLKLNKWFMAKGNLCSTFYYGKPVER